MKTLLKLLNLLKAKGFALASEKANIQVLYKELEKEEQELVSDSVDAVDAMPEEDPKDAEDEQKALKTIKDFVGVEVEAKSA